MALVRRSLLVNLGLAAASLAVALLALEGVARLALRGRGGGKERDEASLYMEYDPHLGWRHRPGSSSEFRRDCRREPASRTPGSGACLLLPP